MCRGKALGGALVILGIVILIFSVPKAAWGAVVGIILVITRIMCIKR